MKDIPLEEDEVD